MVPRSPSTSRNSSAALLAAGGVAAALVSVLAADASSRNNSANMGESFNFIADAAESAAPMVVNIIVNVSQRGGRTSPFGGGLGGEMMGTGSGFIIDENGLIATNAHVVAPAVDANQRGIAGISAADLLVTLNDGRKFKATVHSLDRKSDVALVQLLGVPKDVKLPVARIGSSSELRAGEWCIALGSPLHLQDTVTAGIISSTTRSCSEIGMENKLYEFIQTDAAINQGNSGGPLVNLNGEVIGINTAKLGGQHVSGISFAIPIDSAWQVIRQLKRYRNVKRPYIGMRFYAKQPSGSGARPGRRNVAGSDGVRVLEVTPGSPADKAGLVEGDTIVSFDGRMVYRNRDILERLGYEYGRSIEVKVRRADGRTETLTVISSKPPPRKQA